MSNPIRTNILVDAETQRQINDLALLWGIKQTRNFMIVVRRCVEQTHQRELAKQEEFNEDALHHSDSEYLIP